MTFIDRIRALVAAADPNGTVTIGWLAEQLERDGDTPAPAATARVVAVDLTIADVAQLFDRSESTVRTWVGERAFPNAYKLHGKEWRIPPADVAAMQKRESEAHRRPPIDQAVREEAEPVDLGRWRRRGDSARNKRKRGA